MKTRRTELLLLVCLALACRTPQGVIPPGFALQTGGDGIVIFSLEKPAVHAGERQWVSWTSEETGESLELEAANDGPLADFQLTLPPGRYRMAMTTGDSAYVRFHLLHFSVAPGVVSYGGAIRFYQATPTARVVRVEDDYAAAVARFRASHPELAGEGVLKSLADVQSCGSTGVQCDPGANE